MEKTILNPMALWGREMSNEEMMALIKAAPDLLDACKAIEKTLVIRPYWGDHIVKAGAVVRIRAAIAKATGG